jgi:hypothetical protein
VSHLAFFLVILAGALLGVLSYMAFLGSLQFAATYVGGTVLVALTLTARHVPAESKAPRLAEGLCAVLGVGAYSVIATLYGFFLYGLAYALTYAIGRIADWLQLGWHANPVSVAFWASGPFTLLVGLLLLSFSPIARALFPEVAGVASAYDRLSRSGTLRWAIPVALGGVALSILTYFFWPGSWWWYLIAQFAIIGAGAEPMSVATKWSPALVLGREAVQAMQKLYGILGYETVISPRTKVSNADVDSLLQRVDILAIREQEALIIELKTSVRTNQAVSAADASILPIAARAIARYLSQDSQLPIRVQPVLVLIGQKATVDLVSLAEDEGIKVLSLTEGAVREVLKTEDENVLRELAQRYLLSGSALISAQSAPSTSASARS